MGSAVTNEMSYVLVVADDARMRDLLIPCLLERGIAARGSATGAVLDVALQARDIGAVVIDLDAPDGDGAIPGRYVKARCAAPLLLLTPRGEPAENVPGEAWIADDYLSKPFDADTLAHRLRTLMHGGAQAFIAFDRWRLNRRGRHLIAQDNTIVMLSNAEFDLLEALLATPREPLTLAALRAVLTDAAPRDATDRPDHRDHRDLTDLALANLARKLGNGRAGAALLCGLGDKGYMIDVPLPPS
ncbi:response regulator [Paraburkholderia unamae]|uniref:Two-component system OmpR family response regulator n=1 Tax=Paraburkholderia unamae TaxID=219649 RepID=A0ABX5K685_9BURK|nr:response regulator [Paraburkholderia unamae]PVX61046.1 two-component system OmpR family response regulator [Paraburkholderia unamae]CAG9266312.1 putative Transcriptional regulator [Paraburkholderia unamae]